METFFSRYGSEMLSRTWEHFLLVSVSMAIATLLGLFLGIVVTRNDRLAQPILGFANAVQTIPSLAIFGFLISVPFFGGVGARPAIVALSLYALLPIIRNTYTGITSVDPAVKEVAIGMGMTDRQMLWRVELPLATGTILAGIRVSTVICVGVATIAAAIGAGGLGVFIFRGISTVNNQLILAGALPASILALLADFLLGKLETWLSQPQNERNNIKFGIGAAIAFLSVLVLAISAQLSDSPSSAAESDGDLVFGSKNFTEQVILVEILAQQIEAKTNLTVERKTNLGGTFICHSALKAGEIDAYPEYTGTAYAAILEKPIISDPQKVYNIVKEEYDDRFNIEVMPPLGFENTYALVIREEDAIELDIETISEVSAYTPEWKAGFGYEFLERQDGYPGLKKTYNIEFAKQPEDMDMGVMYRAIAAKQVDLVVTASTDGLIDGLDLYVLEDDKNYFPPYEAIPIWYAPTLEKYPQIRDALSPLFGAIPTPTMRRLNYAVEVENRPAKEVAREFLLSNGFI